MNRANVLARNPAPNRMLGMLVRGTEGSVLINCEVCECESVYNEKERENNNQYKKKKKISRPPLK